MVKNFIISFLFIVFIFVGWQLIENHANYDRTRVGKTSMEAFVPSPKTIFKTFKKDGPMILTQLGHTMTKASIGFLLGVCFAIFMASIFSFVPLLRNLFFPISLAINSFPIVGFAPAIVLALGQGTWQSIVFISALICYFPTLISMDNAFRQTDPSLLEQMRVLNANGLQTLLKVRLPLALPSLFMSMKLAIPASIIGATMGEWLGSRTGIGQLITVSLYQLKPGLLYGSLLAVTLSSSLAILAVSLLERYAIPWRFINKRFN